MRTFSILFSLLAAACSSAQTSPPESAPRMGAMVAPSNANHGAASYTLLNAVVATSSVDSSELDCRGYRDGWVRLQFAGMAAGTDLVGALELRGGDLPAIASQLPLLIDANELITASGTTLPTGLTVDGEANGFAIADTFAADTVVLIPLRNLPPFMSARFTRASGGTGATVTVAVGLD